MQVTSTRRYATTAPPATTSTVPAPVETAGVPDECDKQYGPQLAEQMLAAGLDARCFVTPTASTIGVAIDEQCARPIATARLWDVIGCWAFCCYYAGEPPCTHITYKEASDECSLFSCANDDACPTVPDESATTTRLRANLDHIIPSEVIDMQSDRQQAGDTAGTEPQRDTSVRCRLADGNMQKGKAVDTKRAFTLKRQRVNDMLACSMLCCNHKGCTSAVFYGAPDYTCALHRCMGGPCALVDADTVHSSVWTIVLDKRTAHQRDAITVAQPRPMPPAVRFGHDEPPRHTKHIGRLNDEVVARNNDWVRINKHIANVNYLYDLGKRG